MRTLDAMAAVAIFALGAGQASGNAVTGSGWHVADAVAGNAIPAIFPATQADATFVFPRTLVNLNGDGLHAIGVFLASGGASSISYFDGPNSGITANDWSFNFAGNVTVASGDQFVAGHDDGLMLIVVDVPLFASPRPDRAEPPPALPPRRESL